MNAPLTRKPENQSHVTHDLVTVRMVGVCKRGVYNLFVSTIMNYRAFLVVVLGATVFG